MYGSQQNKYNDDDYLLLSISQNLTLKPENLRFGVVLFVVVAPPEVEMIMDIARNEHLHIMYGFSANYKIRIFVQGKTKQKRALGLAKL